MSVPTRAEALAAIERAEKATKEIAPFEMLSKYRNDGSYEHVILGHVAAARTDVPTFAQAYMERTELAIDLLTALKETGAAYYRLIERSEKLLAAYNAQEKLNAG